MLKLTAIKTSMVMRSNQKIIEIKLNAKTELKILI